MLEVDRAQVVAFRLRRHHLLARLPADSMGRAVAACGVQETSSRTAVLALHARVADVTPAKVDRALHQDRTLLTVWAMRGAPYVVPSREAAIFTTGALPEREDSWEASFGGWAKALRGRTESLSVLVRKAAQTAATVLDGRQLPVEDLRQAIAERVPEIRGLPRPSGAHADLPEPLFRATGQLGVVCIADPRQMTDAILARTDQWLDAAPESVDRGAARTELLRRFLRCYGPATPPAFAEWTMRSAAEAREVFEHLRPELVQVRVEGSAGWLLAADVDELTSPTAPAGVRLLPAHDPYLQQRDRQTLLPDQDQRRRLWRPVGGPGLVLLDGQPAGTWTSRRRGRRLDVTVEPFRPLTPAETRAVAEEAEGIAPLRGAERASLTVKA